MISVLIIDFKLGDQNIWIGGCSRTRTCDPLIKSPVRFLPDQRCFPVFASRSAYPKVLTHIGAPDQLGNEWWAGRLPPERSLPACNPARKRKAAKPTGAHSKSIINDDIVFGALPRCTEGRRVYSLARLRPC
jgi:hypothetical protein